MTTGMVVIRGRLTPDVGAIVLRALEAAADRLYRESAGAPSGAVMTEALTPGQRRADALGRLAETALSADLDRGTAGDRHQVVPHVEESQSTSDGPLTPERGASRGQVSVDKVTFHSAGTTSPAVADRRGVDDGGGPHASEGTLDIGESIRSRTCEDAPDERNRIEPRRVDGTLEVADGAIHISAEVSRR